MQLLLNLGCTVQELSLPGVLARFWECFTCLLRKWKWLLKLHYKRSLGTWAAQLCSGVRGDSTYHEDLAMDRLLVSMFVLIVISLSVWTNPTICLFRTLFLKYMVSRQVFPCDCYHSGATGGRVNQGTLAAPSKCQTMLHVWKIESHQRTIQGWILGQVDPGATPEQPLETSRLRLLPWEPFGNPLGTLWGNSFDHSSHPSLQANYDAVSDLVVIPFPRRSEIQDQ